MIDHETMTDTVSDMMSDAIYVEAGLGLVNSLSKCAGRSSMTAPKVLSLATLISYT